MKPVIIGLAGPARSGKTTAGDYLFHTHQFMTYAFADPLKQAVAAILGISAAEVEESKAQVIDWLADAKLTTPRELMQQLGTDFCRERVHPQLWVRATARRIERDIERKREMEILRSKAVETQNRMFPGDQVAFTAQPFKGVITDVRFENEAEYIRSLGGRILHIIRHKRESVPSHASEQPLHFLEGDIEIDNNRGMFDLFQQLDAVVASLEWRA